ncbi:hypothetical protein H0H93_015124, partial [Arthromyces matolae]
LTTLAVVSAKTVVISVGGNTTNDATTVFQPSSVIAQKGDIVTFNFTNGNHTATQSTFAAPCVPIHDTNVTINGFDSSFRNAGNEQAITTLQVTIDDSNDPIWFYDYNTCSKGGVGVININASSTETLQGFQRNAERLNGTASTSSAASAIASATSTSTGSNPTATNSATRLDAQCILVAALSILALTL